MWPISFWAIGLACPALVCAQIVYIDMLQRARRRNDYRTMTLHYMIHHDREFNVLGMKIPPSWFGGAVRFDVPGQYIVASKTLACDYTAVITGTPCLHCGFVAKENATDITFSNDANAHGLTFPSAHRQTFLLHDTWMATNDLRDAYTQDAINKNRESTRH